MKDHELGVSGGKRNLRLFLDVGPEELDWDPSGFRPRLPTLKFSLKE